MRAKLDGDMRIFVEQSYELVELELRSLGEVGTVELIEDIVDEHRGGDGSQRELQHILVALVGSSHF